MRSHLAIASLAATLLAAPSFRPLAAQVAEPLASSPVAHSQLVTIQPLTSIVGLISGDYEHALGTPGLTLGAGVSYLSNATVPGASSSDADVSYLSAEAKLRYYVSGVPFHGFSIAATAGGTSAHVQEAFDGSSGRLSGVKIGTELDYTWLLGRSDRLALALGVGGKRVFYRASDDVDAASVSAAYPTMRLAVGWAF